MVPYIVKRKLVFGLGVIHIAVLSVNVILDTLEMDSHVKVKLMFCNFYLLKNHIFYIIGAVLLLSQQKLNYNG
jgi:hypothetical protein